MDQHDIDELTEIRHKLKHARDLDGDEIQELYYRKNYLESVLAAEEVDVYGEES